MTGYAMVFLYMIMPIEGLLSAIPTIGSAKVALERIEQVNLELPAEPMCTEPCTESFESVALETVTHRYFRSEERRVGRECVSKCRSRGSTEQQKQKQTEK